MSNTVRLTEIEDSRKLVNNWLKVGARVETVSEDTEDNIMWMTLTSRLGRLQLRRDCYPLDLTKPAHGVWNTLDKIPGSPYRVEDNSWNRGTDEAEVLALYEKLWAKYWRPEWKRLDFLLGERPPVEESPEPSPELMLGQALKWFCAIATGFILLGLAVAW